MSYELRYLPMAVEDIDRLAGYLSRFYPNTAGRVLGEMQDSLARLQEFPQMCEEYPPDPFFRKLVVEDYLVFYHVSEQESTVDVYRILRGSWDVKKQLNQF